MNNLEILQLSNLQSLGVVQLHIITLVVKVKDKKLGLPSDR